MKVRTENLAEIFNCQTPVACVECNRVFDLWDEDDAGEWFYGHDCEVG